MILQVPGKLEMGNVKMNSIMRLVTLMVETAVDWMSTHNIALSVYVIWIKVFPHFTLVPSNFPAL